MFKTVSFERLPTLRIGGAGNGNSYNFKVTRTLECGSEQSVLCHGERDVAQSFIYAKQPVPAELAGPYDCYGRN